VHTTRDTVRRMTPAGPFVEKMNDPLMHVMSSLVLAGCNLKGSNERKKLRTVEMGGCVVMILGELKLSCMVHPIRDFVPLISLWIVKRLKLKDGRKECQES